MHRNSSPAFLDATDQDWKMQWCLIVKWDSILVRWRWGGGEQGVRGPAKGGSREWELFWKLIPTALPWTPRSEVGGEESPGRYRGSCCERGYWTATWTGRPPFEDCGFSFEDLGNCRVQCLWALTLVPGSPTLYVTLRKLGLFSQPQCVQLYNGNNKKPTEELPQD